MTEALRWRRASSDSGFPCFPWYATDPLLDPIRHDATITSLMADVRRAHDAARAAYGR